MKFKFSYLRVQSKTFIKSLMLLGVLCQAAPQAKGQQVSGDKDRETNVRISWDYHTYQEMSSVNVANKGFVEPELHYPRIKRLSDGSLLMTFNNKDRKSVV